MSADKPEAGRTCPDWCGSIGGPDSCGALIGHCFGYGRRHWCSPACSSAGRSLSPLTPLNPAPRPVEPRTFEPRTFEQLVEAVGDLPMSALATSGLIEQTRPVEPHVQVPPGDRDHAGDCADCPDCGICQTGCPGEHDVTCSRKPRPVERCSCPEAGRYKSALEAIAKRALRSNAFLARDIEDIARRALALGGETK